MRRTLAALPILALAVLGLTGCKAGGTVDCPDAPTTVPTAVTSGTCSWTYTPDPPTTTVPPTTTPTTTTVPPTTTTTVPPTTTTSSTPPPNAFPTPTTTGAPIGNTFQPVHNGDMTINQAGTYNALHVTGALHVTTPGVHITNSWIEGNGVDTDEALVNETAGGSARLAVTNTTIGNPSVCNGQPGLGEHDYTADHVRIIGMGDGFRVSGNNVTITNSFVQTCDHATNHDDGVQIYCELGTVPQPCQNITIDHNTLSVANTRNFTAPVFGGDNPGGGNGQFANSRITNNLLWGGVYTVDTAGKNLTITGNRVATNRWTIPTGQKCKDLNPGFGTDTPQGCAYDGWVYGPTAVSQGGSTCSQQGVTWSDNRAVTTDSNWQPNADKGALACA